jgi:hypothetical protein
MDVRHNWVRLQVGGATTGRGYKRMRIISKKIILRTSELIENPLFIEKNLKSKEQYNLSRSNPYFCRDL